MGVNRGGGTCRPTNFQGGPGGGHNIKCPHTILGRPLFFHVSSPAVCGPFFFFFFFCLSERLVMENLPKMFQVGQNSVFFR